MEDPVYKTTPGGDRDDASVRRPRRPMLTPYFIFFILLVMVVIVFGGKSRGAGPVQPLSIDQFLAKLEEKQIKTVVQTETQLTGKYVDGQKYNGYVCNYPPEWSKDDKFRDLIIQRIREAKGEYSFEPPNALAQFLVQLVPWILILLVFGWFISRQFRSQGGIGSAISFGRSRARKVSKEKNRITFGDVAGLDSELEDVKEIIEYLSDPTRFQRLGARIPRGVLLVGPPGTGKTLLAKAIAGEADVPFYTICGSDFVEMFVGVGASRVRDLFRQAKVDSPCVIFLDEIDAVGRRRGSGLGGNHDEREQTLNAILVEMDGFDTDQGVIVIAATNRPDILDPALLRPGRFDRTIQMGLPDVRGRLEILKVHAKKVKFAKSIDLTVIAKTTPTFSGADLEATINEGALLAAMKSKSQVEQDDLEEARDKVKWGRQKKSRRFEEEDRRVTAIHEAGHAIVGMNLPGLDPIHKVTIIPRGPMGGATMTLPEKDRNIVQKDYVLKQIAYAFGGRAAEELFCSDISSGAQNDIKHATQLAVLMVCEWGMSESLGPVSYMDTEEHLFLGREITRYKTHSEATALEIDREVRRIADASLQLARKIVQENRDVCDRVAKALLKYEVLSGQELERIVRGADLETLRSGNGEAQASKEAPAATKS